MPRAIHDERNGEIAKRFGGGSYYIGLPSEGSLRVANKKTPDTLHHFTLKYARPKDRRIATMNSLGQNQAKTRISGAFPNDSFLAELTLLHIENQYLVAKGFSDLQ